MALYGRLLRVEDFGPAVPASPGEALAPALPAALAVLTADGRGGTIEIASAQALPGSTTIPSNVGLRFVAGGSVNVPANATLTIEGPLDAPPAHIFTGAGTVTLGAGFPTPVRSEWWGARWDGATDDTAAHTATFAAAPAGAIIEWPPAASLVSNLSDAANHKIRGAGRRKTTLRARAGATGNLFTYTNAWGELGGFDIDLGPAPTMNGLVCSALNAAQLSNIAVYYGAVGIQISGASGSLYYDRFYLKNQTQAGLQILEGGAEHHFGGGCQVLVDDPAITMQAGVEWSRTAATDMGGWYGQEIRVTRSAGTIVNGFKFHSTAVSGGLGSFMGGFGCPLVADNINGGNPFFIQNMDNARFALAWATGSSGSAVMLDGATRISFDQWFASCPGGAFDFAATNQVSDRITIEPGVCTQGYVLHMPGAGSRPTNLDWAPRGIDYTNATAFTNDFPSLMACVTNNSGFRRFSPGITVLNVDAANKEQSFGIENATSLGKYSMRMDSGGNLQWLPDAFDRTSLLLDPLGNLRVFGNLTIGSANSGQPGVYMGSGAPTLPNGATSVAAGSYYLRTDTPGTANQRVYVATVGGASPTWVGIL